MAKRLADLDITWYEEPAGPESAKTLRAFRERIDPSVQSVLESVIIQDTGFVLF
ncbi:hypothetical protein JCM19274_2795 [Algibacter lectus]|uniref:Uncharacterized protein n=1 Tax=Algibacter lectus TaxID=221126 RepID=A0A090X1W8_9FLAO|nr:hypothetical protein JCM19274_2795 [Algibacter lectus]